ETPAPVRTMTWRAARSVAISCSGMSIRAKLPQALPKTRNERVSDKIASLPAASVLLGFGVLIPLLATPAALAAEHPSSPSPQDAATAKQILSDLLAIDTTYEKGTVAAVESLRKRFLAAGFAESDLTVVANPSNPSQSNLIVRMKGKGKGKPLL